MQKVKYLIMTLHNVLKPDSVFVMHTLSIESRMLTDYTTVNSSPWTSCKSKQIGYVLSDVSVIRY